MLPFIHAFHPRVRPVYTLCVGARCAQQQQTARHWRHDKVQPAVVLTVMFDLQNGMRPVDLASMAGYNHIVDYLTSIDTAAQVGKLQQYSKYL